MKQTWQYCLAIAAIASLVFIPFIGSCPLFDWDEVNFAECAREMIVSGDYSHVQLNYRPFWEKPPLFIWMQAISMNIFGVNEFAARFPNAICSIITLISIFLVGKKYSSVRFGLMWTAVYACTLLPHFYFRSGIIDPWFNLFIFLAIFHAFRFIQEPEGSREWISAVLGGICLGLAVLTKGPVALIVAGLAIFVYILIKRRIKVLLHRRMILFAGTSLYVASSWFLVEWMKGNESIITGFIDYQIRLFKTEDAGHSGPMFYHVAVLLVGCFPASVLFIIGYRGETAAGSFQKNFRLIMLTLFWVVLVLFSIVKTKIVHYSSLCYFPVTFIATIALNDQQIRLGKWTKPLFWTVTGLITLAFGLATTIEYYKWWLLRSGLVADQFAAGNLSVQANWHGYEFLIAVIFLIASVLMYLGLQRKQRKIQLISLFCYLLFLSLSVYAITPRINEYTQQAAIEFYKQRAREKCYIETHNFKSYAYLFYSNRQPSDYINADQREFTESQMNLMEREGKSRLTSYAVANQLWMEHGKIDRPAYLVIKTHEEKAMNNLTNIHKMYSKGGFSFYVRTPAIK